MTDERSVPSVESLGPLLFTAVVFAAFYAMVVRPQKARYRRLQELQAGLRVGTRVMTTAGLHGTVTGLADDTVHLEIAPGVEVEWARAAVARVLDEDAPAAGTAEDAPVPAGETP